MAHFISSPVQFSYMRTDAHVGKDLNLRRASFSQGDKEARKGWVVEDADKKVIMIKLSKDRKA